MGHIHPQKNMKIGGQIMVKKGPGKKGKNGEDNGTWYKQLKFITDMYEAVTEKNQWAEWYRHFSTCLNSRFSKEDM